MHNEFDAEEFPKAEQRRDTELTLGPMMLLGFFFGLVLLCGLCFGVGYSMGSHGAHESSVTGQQPGAGAVAQTAGSLPKPSAAPQNISQPQPAEATAPTPAPSAAPDQLAPALPAPAAQTEPATAPALALMVQIAIVSHQEDADVLVSALRQRGYTATARRDPADNQFHVRIGPFNSHNEANAMRQKLLNDGYNAIVQP
jgi:cell division septation protein DedD